MKVKTIIKHLWDYILDPDYRFVINEGLGLYRNCDDVSFTKKKFRIRMGYELNLACPQTFNEKLQWLKLYDHNPIYTKMVDKLEAKEYVKQIIGEQFIIPTLGVWERAEEIEWDELPSQFVLKVTHDSGGLVICRDKTSLNREAVIKKLNNSINFDYFNLHREWPYKNVPRRIIAEKYMKDDKCDDLRDYKFYCFNGDPKFLYVSEGMADHKTAKMSFVTMDWKMAPFGRADYHSFLELPEKPVHFEKMKELARVLSDEQPFLRVDFYEINGQIYFGELTFCPCAGMMKFIPEEYDRRIGDMLILPNKKGDLNNHE